MVKSTGCELGRQNRMMIETMSKCFDEFRDDMKKEFKDLKDTNINLYNHLSSRLPSWASILGMFLAGLLGSCITFIVFNL